MIEIENIGRQIFREACLDPFSAPVAGAALEVARRLYGRDSVLQARIVDEGQIARHGDRIIIAHRAGISRPRANFVIAQMLARLFLGRDGISDVERERLIAAWICAPTETYRSVIQQVGIDLRALASTFVITETSAALRALEVERIDGAVTTPERVYKRGPGLAWVRDDDVRELARRATKRLRKTRITDEPGRVALFAAK